MPIFQWSETPSHQTYLFMPHIPLPEGLPGILGPLAKYPRTAKHLGGLTQELLRGPSPLTPGERELIAAYVSNENECVFCTKAHSAAARHLLGEDAEVVDGVKVDLQSAEISEKLRALLAIAGKVQESGRLVTKEDVDRARAAGAVDEEIHHTVLIAAAFCMFNRYVDGLGTWTPDDPAVYEQQGAHLALNGYGQNST